MKRWAELLLMNININTNVQVHLAYTPKEIGGRTYCITC